MTESGFNERSHERHSADFADKLKELLPGVEFEETAEIRDARLAVLEALKRKKQDSALRTLVWAEYASICEQAVDARTAPDAKGQLRAELQIAAIVHKALIFREAGNIQRYCEELTDAEEYAFHSYIDRIAEAIGKELDSLTKE